MLETWQPLHLGTGEYTSILQVYGFRVCIYSSPSPIRNSRGQQMSYELTELRISEGRISEGIDTKGDLFSKKLRITCYVIL